MATSLKSKDQIASVSNTFWNIKTLSLGVNLSAGTISFFSAFLFCSFFFATCKTELTRELLMTEFWRYSLGVLIIFRLVGPQTPYSLDQHYQPLKIIGQTL